MGVRRIRIEMRSDDLVSVYLDDTLLCEDVPVARVDMGIGDPDAQGGSYNVVGLVQYDDGWTVTLEARHLDDVWAGKP